MNPLSLFNAIVMLTAFALVVALALWLARPRWVKVAQDDARPALPDETIKHAVYEVRVESTDAPQFAFYVGDGAFELLHSGLRVGGVYSWRRVA